jgi:type IV secretory pathway TrbD component
MAHRSDLPKIAFHPSMSRPIQLAGGDRRLVIISLLLGAYVGFIGTVSFGLLLGGFLGILVWGVLALAAHRAGKTDPFFFDIALRHIRYRGFYPARGRFNAYLPKLRE